MGTHTGSTVTETISYDPWGMPSYTGDLSSRTMWKGLIWEGGPNNSPSDVVGLAYMRGRWYDPQAGRFIQEDPLGVDGSLNLYGFAGDDPVNGSDPSGMTEDGSDMECDLWVQWNWDGDPSNQVGPSEYFTVCHPKSGGDGGHVGGGGGSSGAGPQKTEPKKPKCPAVPAAPAGENLDANVKTARRAGMFSPLVTLLWFNHQVNYGHQWDYATRFPAGGYNDFGNFNYGATGAAAGIPEYVLLRAAGWAQRRHNDPTSQFPGDPGSFPSIILNPRGGVAPVGDDPADQEVIKQGIAYAQRGCHE